MLAILTNLSIRNKIVLMLIFPILGVLYFAADGIINRQELASEMAKVHDLVNIAEKASALVHETQRERGMVAAYIGSQGREFAADLPSQQAGTDRAMSEFREILQQIDVASFGAEIAGRLDTAVRDLGSLSAHRQGGERPARERSGRHRFLHATQRQVARHDRRDLEVHQSG